VTPAPPPRRKPWNKWAVFGVWVGAVALIGGAFGVVNELTSPAPSPTPTQTTITLPSASPSPSSSESLVPSESPTP
jgi:hypothetical protein